MKKDNLYNHSLETCVSVIVPTRNSAGTIEKCLESILSQTYKNLQILVIDGFSSDNTVEIASRFATNIFSIEGERTTAKNFGILKSRCDFLFFVDSDMILEPHVIEECVTISSSDNRIGGVIIPEHSIGSGFWIRVRDFEKSLYVGSAIESARFFRKEFVVQVGGFDENIVFYEESTLPQKIEGIGMSVSARITSSILHNEEGFNLCMWLSKKRRYYLTAGSYSKKYKKSAKMQTSIFYRINVFIVNGKWKNLIRHPILSAGLFMLKILEFFASKL